MDYEKAYKEALERARICRKDLMNLDGVVARMAKDFFEETFPELKDSEDEKTKREIMEYITHYKDSLDDDEYRTWISWLEKQGENKHKFIIGDIISNNNIIYRVDNIVKNCIGQDCYFLVDIESENNGTRYLKLFDSKGKPHNSGETTWLCEQVDAKFEKQGKPKPADKVQPKFKVGDWIVYSRNDSSREILYVYDIMDGRYYFNDNVHLSLSVKECDEKSHLWTIQDAKDGDVLVTVTDKAPFIFKGFLNESHPDCPVAYGGITHGNIFGISGGNGLWDNDDIKPATKEQSDLLFSKMKEAGYEWDAEKKELRKIDARENLTLDGD